MKHKCKNQIFLALATALALLVVSTPLSAADLVGGKPAGNMGDTAEDAIVIPSLGVIASGTYNGREEMFFKFTAEVEGDYYIQKVKKTDYAYFRLFNKRQKEIKDGSRELYCSNLQAGEHLFSIKPELDAKDYSVVVTLLAPYDAKPEEKKKQLFASSKPAPVYEDITVEVKKKKGEETCFIIELPEHGVYHFDKKEEKDIISYELYNEKFIRVRSGNDFSEGLLAGKYYLVVSSSKKEVGESYSFIVTKVGEAGYEEGSKTLLADRIRKAMKARVLEWKWVRNNPLGMGPGNIADVISIIGVLLLGIVVLRVTFIPYKNFMDSKYDYNVLGWPVWVMLGLMICLIFLPLFGFDPLGLMVDGVVFGDKRGETILISILVVYFVITSVMLYSKSEKLFLIPINIVAMLLFFALMFQIILYGIIFAAMVAIGVFMLSMAGSIMQFNADSHDKQVKERNEREARGY